MAEPDLPVGQIKRLYQSTQALARAQTSADVARELVETTVDTLEFTRSAVWTRTQDNALSTEAVSSELSSRITSLRERQFQRGSWLWEFYENDGVQRTNTAEETIPVELQSAIAAPLGSHGVLITGPTEQRAVSEPEVQLVDMLGDVAEAAPTGATKAEQLQTQRDRLRTINQVVRHDIRSNLSMINAHTELLDSFVADDGVDHLETIRENVAEAVDITTTARDITDVVLSADAETHPVNLRSTIEAQLETVRSTHSEVVITTEDSIPDVQVQADEMLATVFRNLFTNAIQHNDSETPEISVMASKRPSSVVVRVADNGPGIAEDNRQRVFEKGHTGANSGSTGFGLHLVQILVNHYNGSVQLDDSEMEGAAFVITLPRADDHA